MQWSDFVGHTVEHIYRTDVQAGDRTVAGWHSCSF